MQLNHIYCLLFALTVTSCSQRPAITSFANYEPLSTNDLTQATHSYMKAVHEKDLTKLEKMFHEKFTLEVENEDGTKHFTHHRKPYLEYLESIAGDISNHTYSISFHGFNLEEDDRLGQAQYKVKEAFEVRGQPDSSKHLGRVEIVKRNGTLAIYRVRVTYDYSSGEKSKP